MSGEVRRGRFRAGAALGLMVLMASAVLVARAALGQTPGERAGAASAEQILGLADVRRGLCVHLGCGRQASAALAAQLAEKSDMLVHGLAFDDASLSRARAAIEAKGLMGRAVVEKVALPPLPYLRDLANLVVIEDFDVLAARGVTMDEVLRVVAPGGVVCLRKGAGWTKTVKPRPKEMDEWPHPHHGPDGNVVSNDAALTLPMGFRWMGGFPSNVKGFAATRAWVIAGGRLYALGINERENLGRGRPDGTYDMYLSARDAFNGLPLWKMNCGDPTNGKAIRWQNAGALVADEGRVYSVCKDHAIAVDGASGKVVTTFATRYPVARLVLVDGTLVAACWEKKAKLNKQWGFELVPDSDVGTVEAYDADTGRLRWSVPLPAYQLLAADGVVYLLVPSGNPPTSQQVVAVDLQTGRERWRVPHTKLGKSADLLLNCAGSGFVVVIKTGERIACALAADDGRVLWQDKSRANWAPLVDGMLWLGGRRDPRTGKVAGRMPSYIGSHHCQARALVGSRFLLRKGWISELPTEPPSPVKPPSFNFTGVRGACVEGMVPANGMLYTAQNNCKCLPGAVYGVVAVGPSGEWPDEADFEKPRPVEKGPAFGTVTPTPDRDDDWPTYRHDAERSGATSARLPEKLKGLWKVQAARPAEGPLASAWRAQLTSCITAPVCAGGRVFVAGTDAGQIIALDAVTGAKVWSTTLGGRIDTPPTVHRGLCLVGCHDGWVYALRAADGGLVWRTRIAPWERRMVAWGQVESVWPAVGSVLVSEGVAYACAGRTSESEGGIAVVALDPTTGNQLWATVIGRGALRQNDVLCIRDGSLAWRYMKLDRRTGARTAPESLPTLKQYGGGHGHFEGAMIDGTWTWLRNRRAGSAFTVGKITADQLVWNGKIVVSRAGAISREKAKATDKPTPGDYAWGLTVSKSRVVAAMALAENAALFAGHVRGAPAGSGGFLWVVSSADGREIARFTLDAPAVHDGLAVAGGRAYVSRRDGTVVCLGAAD